MKRSTVFLVIAALVMIAPLLSPAADPGGGPRAIEVEPKLAARFDAGLKWAVLIGIDEYTDKEIRPNKYCVADARLVQRTLVEKCGYDEKRILLMTTGQTRAHLLPLRTNLVDQIADWLGRAEAGDTVLVFFSGHGFLDDQGQGYLAPMDCKKSRVGLTGLRTDEVRNMLVQCPARQKVLVLDCCHAGGVRGSDQPGPSSEKVGEVFRKAKGLVTLASCQKDEVSLEWDAKRQGLFTSFLTEGLAGAADSNGDGIVTSDELYLYAFDQVPLVAQRDLNGSQTPSRFIPPETTGVFALARVPARAVPLDEPLRITASFKVRRDNESGPVACPNAQHHFLRLGSRPSARRVNSSFLYVSLYSPMSL